MKEGRCIKYGLILTIVVMIASTNASRSARAGDNSRSSQYWVYIGTYTHSAKSKGIYLYRLDTATGEISEQGLAAELDNPEWQCIARGEKFLYTCATAGKSRKSVVAALSIDRRTGKLTALNQQESNGKGTTHIDVDPSGSCAVVANYSSGDISVLPISSDGTVGVPSAVIKHSGSSIDPERQKRPYPHSCNFDPTGKFVLVPDLGVDKVYVYRFDAGSRALMEGDPATVSVEPGSGPRHLSFDPTGKFAYLINEMGGRLDVFSWDSSKGRLGHLQTISTLPPDYKGTNTSAEVHILPNGKFLYASNRGPDDLAIFAIDSKTGKLTARGYVSTQGKGPRDFAIDPTGNFLFAANQDTDTVVVFRIDGGTGGLTPTGNVLQVGSPICVTFLAIN